ncbi:hypothetical protein TNCT_637161 [Trichonephila clavata]|uniref:Uncharacterized protein n=1 Tax=Trichonephila clavata TaxID=2740835 RepID=A0A8X6J010_TRICU|nr:hypothetical protein TNCT_637161 [Trichonephila clavata]
MRHRLWPSLLPHRAEEDPESLLPPLCSPRTPDGGEVNGGRVLWRDVRLVSHRCHLFRKKTSALSEQYSSEEN